MKTNYEKAIKIILKFKKPFDSIEPKVPRKIIGDLGEFYVLSELEKRGINPEHKGGFAGCDIYLTKQKKEIEVKTSLLKNEGIYEEGINFFGWKIQNRNQKKIRKFDILVCVALDNDFVKPRFYIFTYNEAFRVDDVNIKKYPSIKKKICLYENKRAFEDAKKENPELVTKFERFFNRNHRKYLNRWDKINKQ